MKKILQIIIISVIFVSCQSNSDKFKTDINGDFTKVTSIKLMVLKDSLGIEKKDTISVKQSFFDNKKLKKTNYKTYLRNEVSQEINTKFKYNFNGEIKKEIGSMSFDSVKTEFEVNYHYQKNKLSEINSKIELEDIKVVMNEKYFYDSNQNLKKRRYKEFLYALKSKDTLGSQTTEFLYDSNGIQVESDYSDNYRDYLNFKEYYSYNENDLMVKSVRYNKITKLKDSTFYKYEYDSLNNWIYQETIENDLIKQIEKRIIE